MKKGFTLIELLAVIVILAIIALIATPIILGIINDAKEESNERSVELYAAAVKNGIAAHQLTKGEVPAGTYNNTTKPLPFEVEVDGNVVCTTITISEDGKVTLTGCKVNGGTKEYSYGIEEEPPVEKVCSIVQQDESKYSIGDVVTCNIGETPDKFYVIADAELSASTIQMLTEKNIHTTEYRQSDSAGPVAFSRTNYWLSSVSSYPADVYDSNSLLYPIVNEYVSYLSTKLTGTTGSLLTFSQAENLECSDSSHSCSSAPSWVYSTNYWTASAYDTFRVWRVYSRGAFSRGSYGSDSDSGVRPVITISTSEI